MLAALIEKQRESAEQLLKLYWNRAGVKRELKALRRERFELLDKLKEQEGAIVRAQEQLEGLERLLTNPLAAANAMVYFQPVGSKEDPNPGRGSTGKTDETGRFVLKTEDGKDGAVVGTHQIKIRTEGETVAYDGLMFTVERVQGRRIAKVLISRLAAGEGEAGP